jgi:hypothetical protein
MLKHFAANVMPRNGYFRLPARDRRGTIQRSSQWDRLVPQFEYPPGGIGHCITTCGCDAMDLDLLGSGALLLLLLLQIRTQPHLGCCLAAATAAPSAIFMHLCTNSATPYTSRQHIRSCNDVNGNCANRRSRLSTAVAGHEKR